MARITFTRSEVRRIFGLPNTEAVEGLIRTGQLEVHGYTSKGLPIFDAEAVRRAAARAIAKESKSA